MKILRTLLNVEFVIMTMLMVISKLENTGILLENMEALHIEILVSKLNQIKKFLSFFST